MTGRDTGGRTGGADGLWARLGELFSPARARLPRCGIGVLRLVAVDVETTGLDPRRDRLVEVAWVPVEDREIRLGEAGRLIVRGGEVGQSATVHGIGDDAVADGVEPAAARRAVTEALHGRVLLAHFAPMELRFLRLRGVPVVDTMDLERTGMERRGTYPRGEDLRLPRARARHGLPAYRNHGALTDALACAELFLAQTAGREDRPARTLVR